MANGLLSWKPRKTGLLSGLGFDWDVSAGFDVGVSTSLTGS